MCVCVREGERERERERELWTVCTIAAAAAARCATESTPSPYSSLRRSQEELNILCEEFFFLAHQTIEVSFPLPSVSLPPSKQWRNLHFLQVTASRRSVVAVTAGKSPFRSFFLGIPVLKSFSLTCFIDQQRMAQPALARWRESQIKCPS